MVPGSTLRYGSSFCMVTRSPRSFSRRPRLEAVRPLPRLEATPPVTKRCLVETGRDECGGVAKVRLPWSLPSGKSAGPRGLRISAERRLARTATPRRPGRTPLTRNKACRYRIALARAAAGPVRPRPVTRRGGLRLVARALGRPQLRRRSAACGWSPASPNRARATAQATARTNPATASPARPWRVVSPRNTTPDDGRRHGLGQHHGRGGHGHAAAFQRRRVHQERHDPGRRQRVGGRAAHQLRRARSRAGSGPRPRAPRTRARRWRRARGCGPSRAAGPRPSRPRATPATATISADLERRAHRRRALGAGRGTEQAHADDHPGDRQPFPPAEPDLHQPGREHRGDREVGRDHGLHGEQRQPPQRHELGQEPDDVDAEAGHEAPLAEQPDEQARVDPRRGRVRLPGSGPADGSPRGRRWPA